MAAQIERHETHAGGASRGSRWVERSRRWAVVRAFHVFRQSQFRHCAIPLAPNSRIPCLCLLASSVFLCSGASAAPVLRCVLESTGATQTHDAAVTDDPYGVQPMSINDHFRFKAVMMGDAQGSGIEYVKISTYYSGTRGAVLLHQITYNHPLVSSVPDAPSLTGRQWVYSPRLERQFQFECRLLERNR